jgi:hypothetical protein
MHRSGDIVVLHVNRTVINKDDEDHDFVERFFESIAASVEALSTSQTFQAYYITKYSLHKQSLMSLSRKDSPESPTPGMLSFIDLLRPAG